MSIEHLKRTLKKVKRDEFQPGDVIRWTSQGRYTYAALKTEAGWFTTAQAHNPYVQGRVTYEELLEILKRSETNNVVASKTDGWEVI